MDRREFLRTAGGTAGTGAVASATVSGQATAATGGNETDGGGGGETGGGGTPDLGGYLDDVGNFDGTVEDLRGQGEASVTVGAEGNTGSFAFEPPAIHVDNGATVVWEWTGEGGEHNVVHEDGDFESELTAESGFTFEYTFEEDGVYQYFCQPHKGLGMKGAVVVGTDYPTAGGGGAQALEPQHFGVPFQPHFVGAATILAILVSLVFTFFFLKYGASSHAKGGQD